MRYGRARQVADEAVARARQLGTRVEEIHAELVLARVLLHTEAATATSAVEGALRRAVRYLIAIEHVRTKAKQLNLTDAQRDQLREREATEKAAAESALLKLYTEVWLPRVENGGWESRASPWAGGHSKPRSTRRSGR